MSTLPTRRNLLQGCAASAALFAICTRPALADDPPDVTKLLDEVVSPLGDKVMGKADAPNVLVEYASATCDHCRNFHMTVLPELKEKFIDTGRLKLVFREFPLDQAALAAFMLARCAPDDKYFPLVDMFFRRQQVWTKGDKAAELFRITQMAGFTPDAFNACLGRKDYAAIISQSARVAATKLGMKGTPTLFLNGRMLAFSKIEDLGAIIAGKLKP